MKTEPADRLLADLLRRHDQTLPPATEPHLDEETLALFAAGGLTAEERGPALAHLDRCCDCREVAARLMELQRAEPAAEIKAERPASPYAWQTVALATLAVAAAALLIVTVIPRGPSGSEVAEARTYDRARELLVAGRFDEARNTISQARSEQVASDRLRSLEAQAVTETPDAVSLASRGGLDRFGFGLDGSVARAPPPAAAREKQRAALDLLEITSPDARDARLNRAYLLLTLDRYVEAAESFREIHQRHPQDALAWLGEGIARFLSDDFVRAADCFRRALELDPHLTAARVNLAMSLEELNENDQALAIWTALPREKFSAEQRAQIDARIEALRRIAPRGDK